MIQIKHGSTRTVILTKKYAIKIPYIYSWKNFLYGILANLQEIEFSTLSSKLPLMPILIKGIWGLFIIMPRASTKNLDANDRFEYIDAFIDKLNLFNIEDQYLIKNIIEFKPDSVGIYNNKVVALDYGGPLNNYDLHKNTSSDFDILRRIAERGKTLAINKESEYVDLFQHMLDEIERIKIIYKRK